MEFHQVMSVAGSMRLFPDSAEAASGLRLSAFMGMNKAANADSNMARMELAESGEQTCCAAAICLGAARNPHLQPVNPVSTLRPQTTASGS